MIQRALMQEVEQALADTPVVLLNGARQTGKSTLADALVRDKPGAQIVTLDDGQTLHAVLADPETFLDGFDGFVVIDEVQRAPGLFLALKRAVDRDRRPGRFLLTGSANVLLLPRLSESLTGRMEILTLHPFAQAEIEGTRENFIDRLFKDSFRTRIPTAAVQSAAIPRRIVRGGYPEVQARTGPRRDSWFRSYLATILQRDVRDLSSIEHLAAFPRVLAALAARTGGLLNVSDLGRVTGIPQSTLKRYLTLLEAAFLIQPIPAWSTNAGKRVTRTSKMYIADSGLAAHLLGADEKRLGADPVLAGSLVECFVVNELLRLATWSADRPTLSHFRDHAGREIDVILERRDGTITAVEIKSAAHVQAADFRHLRTFAALHPDRLHRGIVLYTGNAITTFGPKLFAVPISELWTSRSAPGH